MKIIKYGKDEYVVHFESTDRAMVLNKEEYKELNKQIEKMKNCRNCKNEKIEGVCGHFTQVGWCKNWELAN